MNTITDLDKKFHSHEAACEQRWLENYRRLKGIESQMSTLNTQIRLFLVFCVVTLGGVFFSSEAYADQTGDCTTGQYCEQNTLVTTTTTSSTGTQTNNNNNVNSTTSSGTQTNTNNNSSTSVATNNNIASGGTVNQNTNISTVNQTANNTVTQTSTSNVTQATTSDITQASTSNVTQSSTNINDSTNRNINESESSSSVTTNNQNQSTSENTNRNISNSNQKIEQEGIPVGSAIAPSVIGSYSQDLCTTPVSSAIQTLTLGLASGRTRIDENCVRIKKARELHNFGMKIAAVSMLCTDPETFTALEFAGTPCPYKGKIGKEATKAWKENKQDRPDFDMIWGKQKKKCRRSKINTKKCLKAFLNS